MSSHYHAIVWIDHLEARIFHFNAEELDRLVLHPHSPTRHIHHKVNTTGSGHAPEDHDFFEQVVEAIGRRCCPYHRPGRYENGVDEVHSRS